MESLKECWVFIPGTNNRFAISNLGHLMKVAKKRHTVRRMEVIATFEVMPLVSSYKTGALGWHVCFDNERHFFARDEVIKLLPEEIVSVDHSMDEAAIKKREETYNASLLAKGDAEG